MFFIDRRNSIGLAIRSLSNLMRRKLFELSPPPPVRLGEMGGQIVGYLCDHPDQALYQRDVEALFCIRRSTASRFLKDLEQEGMLLRKSVPQDARLKQLIPTEKAKSLHADANRKFNQLESLLTQGLSEEEIAQFLAISCKIQRNLGPACCGDACHSTTKRSVRL